MITKFDKFKINEGRNIGIIYHFTTLSDTINIVELDRLFSTQNNWSEGGSKYHGQISFTRDKNLYQEKPKGVSFGVRLVIDGNRLSNDFKIKPVKFSTLWEESEEAVFTIGSWGRREKLKKHQIFDLKKYIISIDLMPFEIYKNRVKNYELDNLEKIGLDEDIDLSNGKIKRSLVNKAKAWLESKGFNVRIVGETINKRSYISDKNLKLK